jgi:hypothetical protein
MSLYPVRMTYLLNRDFHGTVKQWRENPDQLDQEIRDALMRASQYAEEMEAKGLTPEERREYVNNFLAPQDVPDVESPDESLYSEVMEWADERAAILIKERYPD